MPAVAPSKPNTLLGNLQSRREVAAQLDAEARAKREGGEQPPEGTKPPEAAKPAADASSGSEVKPPEAKAEGEKPTEEAAKSDEPPALTTEQWRARVLADRARRDAEKARKEGERQRADLEARVTAAQALEPEAAKAKQAAELLEAGDVLGAAKVLGKKLDALDVVARLGAHLEDAPEGEADKPAEEKPPESVDIDKLVEEKLTAREKAAEQEAQQQIQQAQKLYLDGCRQVLDANLEKLPRLAETGLDGVYAKDDAGNEITLEQVATDFAVKQHQATGKAAPRGETLMYLETVLAIRDLSHEASAFVAKNAKSYPGLQQLDVTAQQLDGFAWKFAQENRRAPTPKETCDHFETKAKKLAEVYNPGGGGGSGANGAPAATGSKITDDLVADPGRPAPTRKESIKESRARIARELDEEARRREERGR